MSGHFFTINHNFFSQRHDEDECYDFQDELFNFEQIMRMSRDLLTEYLNIYSWSKHVKQINKFLIAMQNMWWHFRPLFGQTSFLSVRQFF